MKIELWDLPAIKTYWDIEKAFSWCVEHFGEPGITWQYGNDADPMSRASKMISSSMEITHFIFDDVEDALRFKLTFS